MLSRPTHLAPAPFVDHVDDNARAKTARTLFHEFWNTGDEAVLKRAFAENFADRAVPAPRAGSDGFAAPQAPRAPKEESI
jgi:hypothetical protein